MELVQINLVSTSVSALEDLLELTVVSRVSFKMRKQWGWGRGELQPTEGNKDFDIT